MREAIISSIANGHNSLSGYRSVWHALRLKGIQVPRVVVQEFLRKIDPEGTEQRRAQRLQRRVHRNPVPNYAWQCDFYDKLKIHVWTLGAERFFGFT